ERSIKFIAGESRFKREYFKNFTFTIRDDQIFLDMYLRKPLVKGWRARLDFRLHVGNSKTFQSLFSTNIDHDMNYCALIKGAQESIYRRWFTSMLKVGNFATSCPILKGYYYLHGWTLDASIVPSFLYLGDYRIGLTFLYGRFKKQMENPLLECSVEAVL
ncbi:hypothetical protein KR059_003166, partial [Drosophila kikkawai]